MQEAIQPEGDHDWRGVLSAIETAVGTLNCPVLVKEVGAGLSGNVVRRLAAIGVRHVDVAAEAGQTGHKLSLTDAQQLTGALCALFILRPDVA